MVVVGSRTSNRGGINQLKHSLQCNPAHSHCQPGGYNIVNVLVLVYVYCDVVDDSSSKSNTSVMTSDHLLDLHGHRKLHYVKHSTLLYCFLHRLIKGCNGSVMCQGDIEPWLGR